MTGAPLPRRSEIATEFDPGLEISLADYLWPGRAVAASAKAFAVLAALGIVYMAAATVYDVFMRYVFHAPTSWATETSTYALILTIFTGAAYTHLCGKNVRVQLVLDRLGPSGARDLRLITAWLGLVFVSVFAWQSVLMVLSDHAHNSRIFSLLLTPTWMPKTPIALGSCLLAAGIVADIDRLSPHRSRLQRLIPYLLFAGVALLLVALGRAPPMLAGTHFDLGSAAVLAAVLLGAFAASGLRVGASVLVICAVSMALFIAGASLGAGFLTALLFAGIVFYMVIGAHVAFALAIVGMLAVYFITPVPFPLTLADRAWAGVNSFSLTAVPLKVLMAVVLVRSGMTNELFSIMAKVLRPLPGGLAHAATAGCAVFAAVSGSSVATAATIGTVACPEMMRRGYSERLTYGTVAAGGTLGILVPPSIAMIIYATTVGVPATRLFVAGILPAMLMTLLFMLVVVGWALIYPGSAPAVPKDAVAISRRSAVDALLVLGLVGAIIVALYAGVATATETGSIGVALAFLASGLRGRLTRNIVVECFASAVTVTCFIFLIIVGANIISFGFDYLKISQQIMTAATDTHINRWMVFTVVLLIYVVLGAFLDSISMLVLTLPVVYPVMMSLGFDPLWFGVVLMIMAEVGLIHPPMGMNLFVLQGIGKQVAMREIAIGALPFLCAMFVTVLLLCLFPEIALVLTRFME
jgi:tripartite ATP-independent transporter DctM subunit